ncbi:glycosyltransferase family 39 protein [Neobacillus ginsengisoli]|uniref:4-amino-4-deoxy-L-arabinose transferase-like glycosyltransferase n=1 Tax=Neobacillus ginsengisoli TaxID=904295 RepID=A0ABT9XS13_9BACI|nr:glycosyltransferase family 39 protein [Neobacillus ginsengisoli]MDQ0198347.1 4-amino-4-deoxy-L-arabinose transferase-like glycosyltransferase [Neobacillus ginsengisoli]
MKKALKKVDFRLAGILFLSLILNFYNLKNAGSNTYYTAAVKSMMQNFHAFFYASFDPQGFITVDKPPVALWIQTLSASIFGLSDFSVLLPEAIAGVISVYLMYVLVKPKFGRAAALLSSLVLSCSPIFVAVVRTNNVDSILILTLLIATWALMKSVEKQKAGWLILSVTLIGIGFNIKMLQAYMVVPAMYLFYWIAVKAKWTKKLKNLLFATIVLAVVSLSWAVAVDLVPENERPYIGSSQTNSVLELALGYNGISRLTGMNNGAGSNRTNSTKPSNKSVTSISQQSGNQQGKNLQANKNNVSNKQVNSGQDSLPSGSQGTATNQVQGNQGQFGNGGPPPNFQGNGNGNMRGQGGSGGMFGTGNPGVLRLFSTELSGQISWLLPFVLFAVIGLFTELRENKKFDLQSKVAAFWLAWLVPMMIFFSIAGFFHQYYLSMMGPAIAALVGIGWTVNWKAFKIKEGWKSWLLPISVLTTFLFEALILYQNSISQPLILATVIAGIFFFAVLIQIRKKESFSPNLPMVGILAMLVLPLYWTGITINTSGNSMTPIAGPHHSWFGGMNAGGPMAGNMGGSSNNSTSNQDANSVPVSGTVNNSRKGGGPGSVLNSSLLSYLKKHYNGEKYFLATDSTQSAAPYILNTNYAVMAMGGFSGSDPALTPVKLAKMAKSGEIKYFLLSGRGGMGRDQSQAVTQWIKDNCIEVLSSEWQSNSSSQSQASFGGIGGETLYVYKG